MQDDSGKQELRSSKRGKKKRPHKFRQQISDMFHSGLKKILPEEDTSDTGGGETTTVATLYLGPIPIHTHKSHKAGTSTSGNKIPTDPQPQSEESRTLYNQLRNVGGYNEADKHAVSTPAEEEKTIQSLAQYLIHPFEDSEVMKTRAIFRWITSRIKYDVKGYMSGKPAECSAKAVLKSRCCVCEGYANLFFALAKEAKLEAFKVGGLGKGGDFGTLGIGGGPHAWNAVQINGEWNLLDACWGAGTVGHSGEFVFNFEEAYFLAPPEQFIFTHLPANPTWQLLGPDRVVTQEQFASFPHLYNQFFDLGLELVSHKENLIEATLDDEICVQLKAEEDIVFLSEIQHIKRRTFAQRNPQTGLTEILVRPPKAGEYSLHIFAKKRDEGVEGAYGVVIEYALKVRGEGENTQWLFPKHFGDFEYHHHYLYEPTSLYLDRDTTQHFKIHGEDAVELTVHHQGKRIPLKKGTKSIFEGDVAIGRGEVMVYARYPADIGHHAILKYNYTLGNSNA